MSEVQRRLILLPNKVNIRPSFHEPHVTQHIIKCKHSAHAVCCVVLRCVVLCCLDVSHVAALVTLMSVSVYSRLVFVLEGLDLNLVSYLMILDII